MKKLILVGLLAGLFSSPAFAMGETKTDCERGVDSNRYTERPHTPAVSQDESSSSEAAASDR